MEIKTSEEIAIEYIYDYLDELYDYFHSDKWDTIESLISAMEETTEFERGHQCGVINTLDDICERIRRKQENIYLPGKS